MCNNCDIEIQCRCSQHPFYGIAAACTVCVFMRVCLDICIHVCID